MQEQAILVTTTVATEQQADSLAHAIVENKLAACVQIHPIRSIYRWKGDVSNEPEHLLNIKTLDRNYAALEEFIRERHPYETPEIISIPITGGSQTYLDWLRDSVAG